MSSQLYRLGRAVARRRRAVLLAWLVALLGIGLVAGLSGGQPEDELTIPGTEAQDGLDILAQRFPEASGTTAQVLLVAQQGTITGLADEVAAVLAEMADAPDVVGVGDPLDGTDPLALSEDGRHALTQVRLGQPLGELDPATVPALEAAAEAASQGTDLDVHIGGSVYTETSVHITVAEVLGVVVALVVLAVTFGSMLAAGMPLLAALIGVGIAMAAILTLAAVTPVSSTAPTLALMIGLAVGIDYALFVLSRHRSQLATGMAVEESIARAVATAGSAVVFAGATVIIALCGLFVAGIPFLTVMGMTAALAVAVAVLVALTGLPALVALAGERLRPRPGSRAAQRALVEQHGDSPGTATLVGEDDGAAPAPTVGSWWVRTVTRVPLLTVVVVVLGLVVVALPAKDLALGLPDNGTAEEGTPQRVTYDLVADAYGPGFNAPLLVTVDIIRSTDPLGVMDDLAADLEQLDGVARVGLATPNQGADLGIVQLIPTGGQDEESTAELVAEIRDQRAELEARHGVADLHVTGMTAAAVDISQRLSGALLPFGLLVVGLSLVLLMVVFRSVAVPLKATAGYLLSVLAAFGAVAAVFEWGWFADLLNVTSLGPVISFLPIILMGVLFGLAMDYEVFLVSRMREAYVHGADALTAVRSGFTASARVVTAAAIIMISVFTAFIPASSTMVKPIALGLAVGIFVDAFVVRMTLVPAVLALLGDRAWWLPRRLDRALPSLDVEGAALEHHLAHETWTVEHGQAVVRADGVVVATRDDVPVAGVDAVLRSGQVLVLAGPDRVARRALLAALAGRLRPAGGTLAVLDRVLPDESGWVRARVPLVRAGELAGPDGLPAAALRGRQLVVVDDVEDPAAWALVEALASEGVAVVAGCTAPEQAQAVLPPDRLVWPAPLRPTRHEEVPS